MCASRFGTPAEALHHKDSGMGPYRWANCCWCYKKNIYCSGWCSRVFSLRRWQFLVGAVEGAAETPAIVPTKPNSDFRGGETTSGGDAMTVNWR